MYILASFFWVVWQTLKINKTYKNPRFFKEIALTKHSIFNSNRHPKSSNTIVVAWKHSWTPLLCFFRPWWPKTRLWDPLVNPLRPTMASRITHFHYLNNWRTAFSSRGCLQDVASIFKRFGGTILDDFQRFRLSLLVFVHVGAASLRQLLAFKSLTSHEHYRWVRWYRSASTMPFRLPFSWNSEAAETSESTTWTDSIIYMNGDHLEPTSVDPTNY